MKLTISTKAGILIGIPLAVSFVFVAILAWALNESEKETREQARAKAVMAEVNSITDLFYQEVTMSATYIVTRSELIEDKLNDGLKKVKEEMDELKKLTISHPREKAAVDALEPHVNKGIKFFDSVNKQVREGKTLSKKLQIELQSVAEEFLPAIREVTAEVRMSNGLVSESSSSLLLRQLLIAGVVVNILIACALVTYFNWSTIKRLSVLMDNTVKIGERQPLNELVKGQDEIAELDKVFHEMADKLTALTRKERAVLENAGDVICTIDPLGIFTTVNPASKAAWGYDSEELIGKHFAELVSEETVALTLESMETARSEEGTKSFESQLKHLDGSNLYSLWSVYWSEVEASFFCVVHDITARREIERLKQEFMAVVSHDLRTPLTSIDISLSLLTMGAKGELPAPVLKEVERCENNIKRLIQLINDLLDIEKMGSGKWEIYLDSIVISEVIERAVDSVKAIADKKNIEIILPSNDVKLEADQDRLVQVLVNFLSNSLKFSPEGSAINITAEAKDEWLEVRVIDQGPGIPDEYKESIFDRFQQVKNAETRKKGGTGLGLAICQAIVAEHGGTVGVDSELGVGSEFWFRIPTHW